MSETLHFFGFRSEESEMFLKTYRSTVPLFLSSYDHVYVTQGQLINGPRC